MGLWDSVKSAVGTGFAKVGEVASKVGEKLKNVEVGPPDAPSLTDVVSGNNKKPAAKKPTAKKK